MFALTLLGAAPTTPTELVELRARFLAGDVVSLDRGRALLRERGASTDVGELGLLDDLSRLVRCLPIGPIPGWEAPPYRGVRLLTRLERVRLERLLRDGLYKNGPLAILAAPERAFQTEAAAQPELVRWPVEDERWPDEALDATPLASKCPSAPGAWKEGDPRTHKARKAERAAAENSHLAAVLPELRTVPQPIAARVALTYLATAVGDERRRLDPGLADILESALAGPEPPLQSAGLVLLGLVTERQDPRAAKAIYRRTLVAPGLSPEEDSRVRARLVGLTEPHFEEVLEVVEQARGPRPEDRVVLDNAQARALYALGRWEKLQTFGRAHLLRRSGDSLHDRQTQDLLLRLSLKLQAAPALAWVDELAQGDPERRTELNEQLGALALSAKNLELATLIYDRLRTEANLEREKRGPRAAAAEAKHLADRAMVEVERDDVEAFAGFIDDLYALAKVEEAKPLARFAPHKELARLDQELVPRLVGEVDAQPQRRRYAAVLLEGSGKLAQGGGRWKPILEAYLDPLTKLAGPWAKGREGPTRKEPKAPRKVRQLGEVLVPRLPPALAADDFPTEVPPISTFLVYPRADGTLVGGMPWDDRKAPVEP